MYCHQGSKKYVWSHSLSSSSASSWSSWCEQPHGELRGSIWHQQKYAVPVISFFFVRTYLFVSRRTGSVSVIVDVVVVASAVTICFQPVNRIPEGRRNRHRQRRDTTRSLLLLLLLLLLLFVKCDDFLWLTHAFIIADHRAMLLLMMMHEHLLWFLLLVLDTRDTVGGDSTIVMLFHCCCCCYYCSSYRIYRYPSRQDDIPHTHTHTLHYRSCSCSCLCDRRCSSPFLSLWILLLFDNFLLGWGTDPLRETEQRYWYQRMNESPGGGIRAYSTTMRRRIRMRILRMRILGGEGTALPYVLYVWYSESDCTPDSQFGTCACSAARWKGGVLCDISLGG